MKAPPFDPVPQIFELGPYDPGRGRTPVTIDLSANEGPIPPGIAAAVAAEAGERWRRYPDARGVERLLAQRLGVTPDRVVVTAGADDALDRVLRLSAGPGRRVVLTRPTFTTLERLARLTGAEVSSVPWWEGPFPVEETLARLRPETSVVAVVSPNNPTGTHMREGELHALAQGIGRRLLVLDHAYVEFADRDLTTAALSHRNVVVIRTLSKAWGLAGLRLGYVVAQPETAALVRRAGQPYPVSALTLAAAERLLGSAPGYVSAHVRAVRASRAEFLAELARRGIDTPPSQANFVLPRLGNAGWWRDALAALGIAVRAFPDVPELHDRIRITVPAARADLDAVLAAVDTIRSPQAVLLDLDGVLADVTGSYHEAILRTARSFGVEVPAAEIAAAKAGGNANNDYELTRRLLAARGVTVSLEEITARFQSFYLGARLFARERLIPSRAVLEQLGRRVALGVVTGRPREEAEAFLRRTGVRGLVRAVVCLEDGPAKPDPAPVRLALRRLGAERAWMVGDTPDDVRAARAAGVLPLGVVPPGEGDPAAWTKLLRSSGAARVLSRLESLLEFVP